ncbi:MAG: hypothetical protein JO163_03055 [Methylobacteriaceae bacterium]|nr:hypothetical protein [Methylobacteriaceae bacterium]MBV9701685.1 hypothetical protein [Methylobacteriaceae bacterium]
MTPGLTRRSLIGGAAGLATFAVTRARAQAPALPQSAVALNIVDDGGALALAQKPRRRS